MSAPILDDFKKPSKLKLSRKSILSLIIAAVFTGIFVLMGAFLNLEHSAWEYVAWTILTIAVIASLTGSIFAVMSLIKNEEDMLFQLAGIIGNGFLLLLFVMEILKVFIK